MHVFNNLQRGKKWGQIPQDNYTQTNFVKSKQWLKAWWGKVWTNCQPIKGNVYHASLSLSFSPQSQLLRVSLKRTRTNLAGNVTISSIVTINITSSLCSSLFVIVLWTHTHTYVYLLMFTFNLKLLVVAGNYN